MSAAWPSAAASPTEDLPERDVETRQRIAASAGRKYLSRPVRSAESSLLPRSRAGTAREHAAAGPHASFAHVPVLPAARGTTTPIQRCGIGSSCACPPDEKLAGVQRDLQSAVSGGGAPLPADTRRTMEKTFASDFTKVRVHTGTTADQAATALQARALTTGADILFRFGAFRPGTPGGDQLIAHELTHVMQQRKGPVSGTDIGAGLKVSDPSDRFEHEAAAHAELGESDAAQHDRAHSIRQAREDQLGAGLPVLLQRAAGDTAMTPASTALANTAPPPGPVPPTAALTDVPPASPTGDVQPTTQGAGGQCVPDRGITNSTCGLYALNLSWLPNAYVLNATCACTATPNVPTANCVRKFLQDRLRATPGSLIAAATAAKASLPTGPYEAFVTTVLTPRIYQDHVDAYRHCCCPAGPAPFADWLAVTTIPIPSCALTGWFITHYGSCTGTPGAW